MSHRPDRPETTTRETFKFGKFTWPLLMGAILFFIIGLYQHACVDRHEEKQAQVVQRPQAPAAVYERFYKEAGANRNEPVEPKGNAKQEHTIIHGLKANQVKVSVDGTNEWNSKNPFTWSYHQTGLKKIMIRPGELLRVVARCETPRDELDYSVWGDKTATPVWGEAYHRPLLPEEKLSFFIRKGNQRYAGNSFGAIAVVLVSNGQRLPGRQGWSWTIFKPNQSVAVLTYQNLTEMPVTIEIGLHRNLFSKTRSVTSGELESCYPYSGHRGGQYWTFTISANIESSNLSPPNSNSRSLVQNMSAPGL